MCNSCLIVMIAAIGVKLGMFDSYWFWLAYVAAIFFNTNWWQRKEKRLLED